MKFYYFQLFVEVFLSIKLLYSTFMLILNCIYLRVEDKIKMHALATSRFSYSLFASHIYIFKDFNIV